MNVSRILVVEDELAIRQLFKRVFSGPPYQMTAVSLVREGITQLESEEFDLLLTDLHFPDGKGAEIVRRFNAKCPAKPVIVMTGSLNPIDQMAEAGLKVSGFLLKPFDLQELRTIVARVFEAKPCGPE